jgi:hypothetical protein
MTDVLRSLNKNENINHEQLKGTLHLVIGTREFSLLTINDWSFRSQLWPALVNSQHSEKKSIIRLLDSEIANQIKYRFCTSTITLKIPDSCVDYARSVWTKNKSFPKPAFECPLDEEISQTLQMTKIRDENNINAYNEVIENLVILIEEKDLYVFY